MTTEVKFRPVAELDREQLRGCLLRERPVEASHAITRLANDLAFLIVDSHPRFSRGEFLKACEIDDKMLAGCHLPPLSDKA